MPSRPRSSLSPGFDVRWLLALLLALAAVWGIRSIPREAPDPMLQLVALGPDGGFRDTLDVPASWRDTTAGGVRVPLFLGVRNTGTRPGRPERLSLSLPVRYRLMDPAGALTAEPEAGAPLVTYSLEPALAPVEPGRLPTLLPAHDTLWLRVLLPRYHCVLLADSVPELIPASRPPLSTLANVRIFYSLEGGDLTRRRTGTLTVRLDTAILAGAFLPASPVVFPAVVDTALATPAHGPLQRSGSRRSECGEGGGAELTSTLWVTPDGGRVITLALGGVERKRLYDLDGDGVIERESWDADGDGTLESTRRARLPTPAFLIPSAPSGSGAPDSLPGAG